MCIGETKGTEVRIAVILGCMHNDKYVLFATF